MQQQHPEQSRLHVDTNELFNVRKQSSCRNNKKQSSCRDNRKQSSYRNNRKQLNCRNNRNNDGVLERL